ncbi:MAG: phosphotransferase family protein [bacterium]|nr:phosphotransferase family protein [bacterium]
MANVNLDPPETAPIRAGEEFDTAVVEACVKERVPGLEGSMKVLQFPGGHANLTYLLQFANRELVLRRPPLGPVAPKSHDMAREYKVLSALNGHFEQAPHAYLLCEDTSLIGAIFFVMERCVGTVVRGSMTPDLEAVPDARRRMSNTLIDVMTDFHDLDYSKLGLDDLGKPEGFVQRQVQGWKGRWDKAKNEENPLFERMFEWLVTKMPSSSGASLVHNDLKFDNVIYETGNPDHIVALLDWDMTTLGDPLIDLGTLLGYWAEAGDPPERGATTALTAQPGFPTRRQIAERYAERRGVAIETIGWYEAFALWKTAVVLQQIYIRWVRGQTKDSRFEGLGERVHLLIRFAADVAKIDYD